VLKLFHVQIDHGPNSDHSLLEILFETAEQTPPYPKQNTNLIAIYQQYSNIFTKNFTTDKWIKIIHLTFHKDIKSQ